MIGEGLTPSRLRRDGVDEYFYFWADGDTEPPFWNQSTVKRV